MLVLVAEKYGTTGIYPVLDEYYHMADTEKVAVTLPKESVRWLETSYPDALNTQEAIRQAVADARLVRASGKGSNITLSDSE